ncbi:hypothetical protein AB1K70_26585 [Bremerella sp. JC770]|uniref:hypothetical protein n=1 Tax=Bremerella sp. JC770 TaxID=3232137 RepID=UPI003458D133
MFYDLLSWCVLLIVAIAAVEYFRWLFSTPPGEELEANQDREGMKEACRHDLWTFCEYYLGDTFTNSFTPHQTRMIAGLQSVILFGGHLNGDMYHGEGSTSILKAAAIWAAAYRHRAFIVVLTGHASNASMMRRQVESELWHNERLWEDFPQSDPWPPIGFLAISESLKGVIETNAENQRIRPDCVLADSIVGGVTSFAAIDFRRRAFQRFVGGLHFNQPGERPLAIIELECVGGKPLSSIGSMTTEELRAKCARASKINTMTAEEIRATFAKRSDSQPIKAGQAYVLLDDPEEDVPAAPQDPHTAAATLRNVEKAREAVLGMRSQHKTD